MSGCFVPISWACATARYPLVCSGTSRTNMAPKSSLPDLATLVHTFSLDYGTTKIRVSHRLSRLGEDPDPSTIKLLFLQKRKALIPSRVGFVKAANSQWDFHWGVQFQDVIEKQRPGPDEVFEIHGLKMCLYPTEVQGEHRRILEEELRRDRQAPVVPARQAGRGERRVLHLG